MTLQKLANACNQILEESPVLPLIGVPWMHFTNTRQVTHKNLLNEAPSFVFGELFFRVGWACINVARLSFLLLFLRIKARQEWQLLKTKKNDIVIKTWALENGNPHHDFYFGGLASQLHHIGNSVLVLSGNVLKKKWDSFIRNNLSVGGISCLPEFVLLHIKCLPQLFLLQIETAFCLYQKSFSKSKGTLERRILRKASCDVLRLQTTLNCLYFWIGKEIVKQWKPKAVITLYEGHAWEQCFWKGVKEASSHSKCVGYQHTVIMPHALSLYYLSASKLYQPDIVLCSGYTTLEMLKGKSDKVSVEYIPFGSFRYPRESHVLRYPAPVKRSVLVVPEGILKEAVTLFDVALEIASQLKEYTFIFRCHPVLPFKTVSSYLKQNLSRFSNVEVSNRKNIEEDFAKASIVLYRGSSSVLYAILNGLKPIYFEERSHEYIDPLFRLEAFREVVDSKNQLCAVLKNYLNMDQKKIKADWLKACEYVKRYTIPVEDKAVHQFLERIQ